MSQALDWYTTLCLKLVYPNRNKHIKALVLTKVYVHKHRRIATVEQPEKSKKDRVVIVAPLVFGMYKGAETYSRISAEKDRASEQLRTAQAAFRKAKKALEVDTELANWRVFQKIECKTDASTVICSDRTTSKVYKMKDLDERGQQLMKAVVSARDKADTLTAEVGVKEHEMIVNSAGAVVGWAGLFYGLMGAVILFRKISRMIKKGVASLREAKERVIEPPALVKPPEPIKTPPKQVVNPDETRRTPEPVERVKRTHRLEDDAPRPKTRPSRMPTRQVAPPIQVDVRVERTVRDSIEARFRNRTAHEARLIELSTGPLTTFVTGYIAYIDKPAGSRGTFGLNGNVAGFKEKWKAVGTLGFADWRVFSCNINGTGRLVVMIDIEQRRFGVYGVYSDHSKYTSDVAGFDPRNVRPSIEIAHV